MCNIRYSKLKNQNICTEGTAEVFYLRINFTLLLNTALKSREEDEKQGQSYARFVCDRELKTFTSDLHLQAYIFKKFTQS